jgi:Holliday junction resolvasome RuvABC ATP-dependent DNA helicase subunit
MLADGSQVGKYPISSIIAKDLSVSMMRSNGPVLLQPTLDNIIQEGLEMR